jgi:hypothetical protein
MGILKKKLIKKIKGKKRLSPKSDNFDALFSQECFA